MVTFKKKKKKKNTKELEFLCMSLNFAHKIDAGTFLLQILLTLSCRMLKISQTYFKNLAVFTPQDFKIKFGNFSTLCMTVLSNLALVFKCLKKQHFAIFTGKNLCWSLFLNIEKFLRTPFFIEHLRAIELLLVA